MNSARISYRTRLDSENLLMTLIDTFTCSDWWVPGTCPDGPSRERY